MKLSELAAQYVAHKQSMGMRFCTEERTLKSFCRAMGNIAITEVQGDRVHAYIAGTGPVTRFWHRKHQVLLGFYRFALARGYVTISPLPTVVPKPPRAFVPHIYSHDELRCLVSVTRSTSVWAGAEVVGCGCDVYDGRAGGSKCRVELLEL